MSLKVALQIDPLEKLNLERDTSLLLAYEAQQRGYPVSYFHPSELTFQSGKVSVNAHKLNLTYTKQGFGPHQGDTHNLDLNNVDVVLMRQDPPFDLSYIASTYLLDKITDKTLVLNNPAGVRNSVEKLLPLDFPKLIPPTLISQNWDEIEQFCHAHIEVIIKPVFDFGGHNVFRVKTSEGELKSKFQFLNHHNPGLPVIVQPFLEQILQGDKRIILIDGELIGGYRRIPKDGDFRSNQLMGATVEKCELSAKEIDICQIIGPRLKDLGLFLVGIDVIGEYLIEINVTSPTGLVALNHLKGIQAEKIFWDKAEKIIENKGQPDNFYYNSRKLLNES